MKFYNITLLFIISLNLILMNTYLLECILKLNNVQYSTDKVSWKQNKLF